jgi:hypothetical protein
MAPSSPLIAAFLLAAAAAGVAVLYGQPLRLRQQAASAEAVALEPLGAPTYLAFHLRRVEATFERDGRDRAELAAAAVALAEREWRDLAGDISAADARDLRADVQAFAAALRLSHGAVQRIAELRQRLLTEAIPARDAAMQRLAEVVAPYVIEAAEIDGVESHVVEAMVAARIDMGTRAREQLALAEAEAAAHQAAVALDRLLTELGQVEGELAPRVEAAHWAIEQAAARHAVRTGARSLEQITADIERLEAEVERLHRPEYTIGTGSAPEPVDVEALLAERSRLQISVADMERAADAIGDLEAERREARARLAAVAQDLGVDDTAADDLRDALLAHLGRAARGGPAGEAVPVILDDPISQAPAERRWELMDMLRRLGEQTQVIYLTGDAFIGAWARRRAEIEETILLLEPVE